MSNSSLRIAYYPAFTDDEQLSNQVVRACWYLNQLSPKSIVFPTNGPSDFRLTLAKHYDPNIETIFKSLSERGVLQFVTNEASILDNSDVVICWRDKADTKYIESLKKSIRVFDVSHTHRMEGSFYIDVVDRLCDDRNAAIALGKQRLSQLASELGAQERAYVFCTGPSIEEYKNYHLNSGVSIICNSVINDEEFMSTIKPHIHVFADPIFHFGCSSYAYEFRKKLVDTSTRYNLTHIVPIKYWNAFKYQLPELEARSLPIPYSNDQPINFDLLKNFSLKTTDNVLTFLMLPLAGTMAPEVHIFGCDGRPLAEDDYFWKHNEKVQFSNEMESIQKAHPSFFKLDYNEYYLRHCDRLEEYFGVGEKLGMKFLAASHSYIPALRSRYIPTRPRPSCETLLLSINPDLTDEFGHFLHMDNRISEAGSPNISVVSLANINANAISDERDIVPTFTAHTWAVRSNSESATSALERFRQEIKNRLVDLTHIAISKHAYMYTGDIAHLHALLSLEEQILKSKVTFHLNLFFSSFEIFELNFKESARYTLYQNTFAHFRELEPTGIRLYVESPRTQRKLEELFDVSCAHWPMINITDSAVLKKVSNVNSGNTVKKVFFPGTGQLSKGIDVSCAAIEHYNEEYGQDVEFILRDLPKDTPTNNKLIASRVSSLHRFENVTILSGVISDTDYASMYGNADIMVIPYRKSDFYARTSAAVTDALFYGVPVLVTEDTWLSDEIRRFDQAYTFEDGNAQDVAKTIRTALMASPKVVQPEYRGHWLKQYDPSHLLEAFGLASPKVLSNSAASGPATGISKNIRRPSQAENVKKLIDAEKRNRVATTYQAQIARSEVLDVAESLLDLKISLEDKLLEKFSELETQLFEISNRQETLEQRLQKSIADSKSNRDLYQRFDRTLSPTDLGQLFSKWLPLLRLDISKNALAYAAELICEVETRSVGRLASGIQDAVLRSLIARAAAVGGELRYLEIGTLFGVNMCAIFETTRYDIQNVHLSSIDPLESYYDQSKDVLTGLPINEQIVLRNLRLADVPTEKVRLIKRLSTDDQAVQEASKHQYHCLLIDGDHTYEGVKNDFERFACFLSPGAYLIVDDYGAKEWPDVTRYVDESIRTNNEFEFVGHGWRTIVFRRKVA